MVHRTGELWKGRKVMYFVATNHIEYFDRAVTRSERFDAIIFMSPPSFQAKTRKLFRILQDTYNLNPSLTSDVTEESIEAAKPTQRCKAAESASTQAKKNAIRTEGLPKDCTLAKFALLRWDEMDELALQVEAVLGKKKSITKHALDK